MMIILIPTIYIKLLNRVSKVVMLHISKRFYPRPSILPSSTKTSSIIPNPEIMSNPDNIKSESSTSANNPTSYDVPPIPEIVKPVPSSDSTHSWVQEQSSIISDSPLMTPDSILSAPVTSITEKHSDALHGLDAKKSKEHEMEASINQINSAISGVSLKPISQTGLVTGYQANVIKSVAASNTSVVENNDSIMPISDISEDFYIPPAPPLPPQPESPVDFKKDNIHKQVKPFKEELEEKFLERQEHDVTIQRSFKEIDDIRDQQNKRHLELITLLEKYNLWTYDHKTGEKLNKKFFELLINKSSSSVKIDLSEDIIRNNFNMELGLLKITQTEETILLSGLQKHVILLYTTIDNKKIVWAYLTSDKSEANIVLSDYQPFKNKNDSTHNEQRLYVPKNPIIVNNSDIKELPQHAMVIAEEYLKNQHIRHLLIDKFIKEILPRLQVPIGIYDGKGITEENITQVMDIFEKKEKKIAQKWFNDYKSATNKQTVLINIENGKKQHIVAYNIAHELIKEYENK